MRLHAQTTLLICELSISNALQMLSNLTKLPTITAEETLNLVSLSILSQFLNNKLFPSNSLTSDVY